MSVAVIVHLEQMCGRRGSRSTVPIAHARYGDSSTMRFQRQSHESCTGEPALHRGRAVIEDPTEDDAVFEPATVLDPRTSAACVVRTGALRERFGPLAGEGDGELLRGARRRHGSENQGHGQQGYASPAHGNALGFSRGIRALARYCSPVVRVSEVSLTKSRTQTVPSATLIRVEASQRSTTSQVVPRTVAEP